MATATAAVPMCIDCGERTQPARHDGDPGTHHRCDPCARVYLRRRELRDRLTGGRWSFFAPFGEPGATCTQCEAEIPYRRAFFRFGADPEAGGDTCCWACAIDAGWLARLNAAAPVAPVLASAWIGLTEFDDGPLGAVIRVPPAQPAVAASAVRVLHGLWDFGQRGGIAAGDPDVTELSVSVTAPAAEEREAVELAGGIACWLAQQAHRVEVPRAWYRDIRATVYERVNVRAARRLARV